MNGNITSQMKVEILSSSESETNVVSFGSYFEECYCECLNVQYITNTTCQFTNIIQNIQYINDCIKCRILEAMLTLPGNELYEPFHFHSLCPCRSWKTENSIIYDIQIIGHGVKQNFNDKTMAFDEVNTENRY